MKYLSFFLALTTFLCYTGICADISYSNNTSEITTNTSCHGTKKQDTSSSAISYKNSNHINHKIDMCQVALPNAPQGYDLNQNHIIFSSPAVYVPILEINKTTVLVFSFNIKEHHPPELFLSNSSFLL
jgi:hypothetical protein